MLKLASTPNAIAGPSKRRCVALTFGRRAMSVRPEQPKELKEGDVTPRKKVTIQKLQQMKDTGVPIAMLTAYDYPTGRACETYGVDITLVGDSLAQVCLGYDSTTRLTMDEMLHHVRATARGSQNPFLVADMPFGSYQSGRGDAMRNAVRLLQEGGAEGVKMEGGIELAENVYHLTRFGIPVMGHVGLLPQRHTFSSGYRVQGKDMHSANSILKAAQALEDAGAFAIVLEAIPSKLGDFITRRLRIPTIGIGAGPETSGQVLVWDDLVGTWNGHKAKFVRRFADARAEHKRGVLNYIESVRNRRFPNECESYTIDPNEWQQFMDQQKTSSNII